MFIIKVNWVTKLLESVALYLEDGLTMGDILEWLDTQS